MRSTKRQMQSVQCGTLIPPIILAAIIGLSLLFFEYNADAATAFTRSDCETHVMVSNKGLTLSDGGTANFNNYPCRANRVKYIGKQYFEFTYSGKITGGDYVGITAPSTIIGAPNTSAPISQWNPFSQTPWAVLGFTFSGQVQWENSALGPGGIKQVMGHTGAFAADFDTDPIQAWFTSKLGQPRLRHQWRPGF